MIGYCVILTTLILSILIFLFTTIMALAGVGAAFIVIPLTESFGYPLLTAMALGLLLNTVSTGISTLRHLREHMVEIRMSLPVVILSIVFTPIGAYFATAVPRDELRLIFGIALLLISANMFYRVSRSGMEGSEASELGSPKFLLIGGVLGALVGFIAGLIGIGGGAIILPFFLFMGMETKRAASTTSFVVMFSSLTGFFSKAALLADPIPLDVMLLTVVATVIAAALGSYLMHFRLNRKQIKVVIAVMVLLVGLKTVVFYFL